MDNKDISEVLEYLYKQGKKDLALAVIKAINTQPTQITYYPQFIDNKPTPNILPYPYNQPYYFSGVNQQ